MNQSIKNCPEIKYDDYPINNDFLLTIEEEHILDISETLVFPFVRRTTEGCPFVDVYIFDVALFPDKLFERFIIRDGFCLPAVLEKRFHTYNNGNIKIDEGRLNKFNEEVIRTFPHWHFLKYPCSKIQMALEHLYCVSHPCAVKEILYKSGLNNIAFWIEQIPHNPNGTSPSKILNLPLKLLRILNQETLIIEYMFDPDSLTEMKNVYNTYCSYINEMPSVCQWGYLMALYENNGTLGGEGFNRIVYNRLKDALDDDALFEFERFLILRRKFSWKIKIPTLDKLEDVNRRLEKAEELMDTPWLDGLIRERKEEESAAYEYHGEKFHTRMPGSIKEIIDEAISQGNCLMDSVEQHASGKKTIIFLRKNDNASKSFVTMEVDKDHILRHALGQHNKPAPIEVYQFLFEYANQNWLYFDPYHVIFSALYDNYGIEDEEDPEEISKLIGFAMKHKKEVTLKEDNDYLYEQMLLEMFDNP